MRDDFLPPRPTRLAIRHNLGRTDFWVGIYDKHGEYLGEPDWEECTPDTIEVWCDHDVEEVRIYPNPEPPKPPLYSVTVHELLRSQIEHMMSQRQPSTLLIEPSEIKVEPIQREDVDIFSGMTDGLTAEGTVKLTEYGQSLLYAIATCQIEHAHGLECVPASVVLGEN